MKKDGTITNRNLYIYVEGIMARLPIAFPTPSEGNWPYVNLSLSRSKEGGGGDGGGEGGTGGTGGGSRWVGKLSYKNQWSFFVVKVPSSPSSSF